MALGFENFYESTLSAPITDTDTYIPLTQPPSTTTEGWLLLDYDEPSKREFIYYTSKDSGGVTLSSVAGRGKDDTTAIPHLKNAKVRMTLSAGLLTSVLSGAVTAMSSFYPVGSIYTNANVNTNPATLLGFGTWEAFGTGRVLVGVDGTQTEFNTLGKTGGAKTHTLTQAEIPAHSHTGSTSNAGSHTHSTSADLLATAGAGSNRLTTSGSGQQVRWSYGNPINAVGDHAHSFTTNNAGSGGAHNNLQPFVTVYMWRRTA